MVGLKRILFCLFTLVIIITGFYMPFLASKGLDYKLSDSVEQMENKKISLDLSNSEEDIRNAWTFFNLIATDSAVNASIVEVSEKSKVCNLTYDKVEALSLKILESLNVSDYHYDDFKAVPNLFINIGNEMVEQTSVYWRCSWKNKSNMQQVMWIDDVSGKMVGLIINDAESGNETNTKTEQSVNDSNYDIPKEVMALVEYCKENYLAADVICNKGFDKQYIIEFIMNKKDDILNYPITVYFDKGKCLTFNVL